MSDLYKVCTNPNDPKDKSLCIVVRDDSPFDGAIVRYTKFKLIEQELDGNDIACQYEYEIEVPPHDLGYEITEEDGDQQIILFQNKVDAYNIFFTNFSLILKYVLHRGNADCTLYCNDFPTASSTSVYEDLFLLLRSFSSSIATHAGNAVLLSFSSTL